MVGIAATRSRAEQGSHCYRHILSQQMQNHRLLLLRAERTDLAPDARGRSSNPSSNLTVVGHGCIDDDAAC